MMQKISYLVCLIVFAGFLLPSLLPAADQGLPEVSFLSNKKSPVDIVADRLDFDQKARIAEFSGQVVARQDETRLDCDQLKIVFAGEDQQVKEIIATGKKVEIQLQGKKAVCRKMHYFAADRRILLSGNPSLDDGRNVITGEEIEFFPDEERSVVKSGSKKRVKTTIFPGRRGF